MLSEYVKVFCALDLYYLTAFEMAVRGGRIDVVDWNGWSVSVEKREGCAGGTAAIVLHGVAQQKGQRWL